MDVNGITISDLYISTSVRYGVFEFIFSKHLTLTGIFFFVGTV